MGGKKKKKTKQQLEEERLQKEEEERKQREEEERRLEEERKAKEEQERLWKIACFNKRMTELKRLKEEQEEHASFLEDFQLHSREVMKAFSDNEEWETFVANRERVDVSNELELNEMLTSLLDTFASLEIPSLDSSFKRKVQYSTFRPCNLSIFDLNERDNGQESLEEEGQEGEEERRKAALLRHTHTLNNAFLSFQPLMGTFDDMSSFERKKGFCFDQEEEEEDSDLRFIRFLRTSKSSLLNCFLAKRDALISSTIKYADRLLNEKGELQIEYNMRKEEEDDEEEEESTVYPLCSEVASGLWGNYNDFKGLKSKNVTFPRLGLKLVLPKQVLQQGLVLNCNLLPALPSQEKSAHRGRIGSVLDIRLLPTMAEPIVLPGAFWTIRNNQRNNDDDDEEEEEGLVSAAYPTSVYTKVIWDMPKHLVVHESFLIKRWNYESQEWEEEGIADVGYSQEKHQVQFSIQHVGFFSLFVPREVHLPLKKWSLAPKREIQDALKETEEEQQQEEEEQACRFYLQTKDGLELAIDIRKNKAKLAFPSEEEDETEGGIHMLSNLSLLSEEGRRRSRGEEDDGEVEEKKGEEEEEEGGSILGERSLSSAKMHFGSSSMPSLSKDLPLSERLGFMTKSWFCLPELLFLLDRCGVPLVSRDEDFLLVAPSWEVPSSQVEMEHRQKSLLEESKGMSKQDDSANPYHLQLKKHSVESFAYQEMSLLSPSFEFSSSKWNMWLPEDPKSKLCLLARESSTFSTPLFSLSLNQLDEVDAFSGFDWESVLIEIDSDSSSHKNAPEAKLPTKKEDDMKEEEGSEEEKEEKEEEHIDFSGIQFKLSLVYPSEKSQAFDTTPKLHEQEYTNEESDKFGTHSSLEATLNQFVASEESLLRSREANPLFQGTVLALLRLLRPLSFA